MTYRRWTDAEVIVATLRDRLALDPMDDPADGWVCGSEFLRSWIPTYSQRIGELVAQGVPIERGRCSGCQGVRHRSPLGRYRLERASW